MKKTGDLKKRWGEEGYDFKTGQVKNRLLSFVILISLPMSAQIPINGFCALSTFKLSNQYDAFFPLNFDGNQFQDILLFSRNGIIALLAGGKNKSFQPIKSAKLNTNVDAIVYADLHSTNTFFYLDRRGRSVYVMNLTSMPKIETELIFKSESFPASVLTANITPDTLFDIVLYGPAHQGICIIKNPLAAREIIQFARGDSYSSVCATDINYDGFNDLIAFNIGRQCLTVFYNDGRGFFNEVNSIPLPHPIELMKCADLNADGYEDIIYICDTGIFAIYGNPTAALRTVTLLRCGHNPDDIIPEDFNGDGMSDLAIVERKRGEVTIYFQKSQNAFYEPVRVRESESITFISLISLDASPALCILDADKNMQIFSRINKGDEFLQTNLFLKYRVTICSFMGKEEIRYTIEQRDDATSIQVLRADEQGVPTMLWDIKTIHPIAKILAAASNEHLLAVCALENSGKSATLVSVDLLTQSKTQKHLKLSKNVDYHSGCISLQDNYLYLIGDSDGKTRCEKYDLRDGGIMSIKMIDDSVGVRAPLILADGTVIGFLKSGGHKRIAKISVFDAAVPQVQCTFHYDGDILAFYPVTRIKKAQGHLVVFVRLKGEYSLRQLDENFSLLHSVPLPQTGYDGAARDWKFFESSDLNKLFFYSGNTTTSAVNEYDFQTRSVATSFIRNKNLSQAYNSILILSNERALGFGQLKSAGETTVVMGEVTR